MATRLGSAGRGCIGVSAGVSSSIVRGLRSIRATVSTRDIVFGNGIPLLSPCHADQLQKGEKAIRGSFAILQPGEAADSSLALHDRSVSTKKRIWLNLR